MASYFAVTPNDSQNLPQIARAIYVGVAGDIMVQGEAPGDALVLFKAMPQGWNTFPFPIARIGLSSTTATNIVAAAA